MGSYFSMYASPTINHDEDNAPSLRELITARNWGLAKQRLLDHPEQASLYAHFVEDSVLVNAIEAHAPDELLVEILEAYPDAVFHTIGDNNDDNDGMQAPTLTGAFPLHIACRCGTSLEFVKKLVEFYPDSVRVTIRDGTLALHHARNVPVVRFLIDQYPESLSHTDLQGRLPLHHCILSIDDHQNLPKIFDLVRVLVENNSNENDKSGIMRADSQGETPLGLLCQYIASQHDDMYYETLWEILRYLASRIDSTSSSASVLHSVIALRLPILDRAIQKFPEQLGKRDSRGQTPLFLASGMKVAETSTVSDIDPSASNRNQQAKTITDWVDVIRSLLDAYPVAARMTDSDGRLPIDIAAERQNDERILEMLVRAEPRAVETRDLRDKLFPFLAAARTSNLGAIYQLLREKPHVLQCLRQNRSLISLPEGDATSKPYSE